MILEYVRAIVVFFRFTNGVLKFVYTLPEVCFRCRSTNTMAYNVLVIGLQACHYLLASDEVATRTASILTSGKQAMY
jgi:hypothetical protein